MMNLSDFAKSYLSPAQQVQIWVGDAVMYSGKLRSVDIKAPELLRCIVIGVYAERGRDGIMDIDLTESTELSFR